jgi:hypothetical protein
MRATAEQQVRFLARDVLPIVKAVCEGFTPDPGTSDLDDEQPVHITIPLGEYRRAVRLLHELEKA